MLLKQSRIHLATLGSQGQSGVALIVGNIVRRPWDSRVSREKRGHGPGTTSPNDGERLADPRLSTRPDWAL